MRDIPGYEGRYAATSCGRIWSHLTKRFLKAEITAKGYHKVHLTKADGSMRYEAIHRLVAMTYIPNPLGLETVNHIDECKDHNYITNLEWMSRADNVRYGNGTARSAVSRSKPVYCIETEMTYPSLSVAANVLNVNVGDIS